MRQCVSQRSRPSEKCDDAQAEISDVVGPRVHGELRQRICILLHGRSWGNAPKQSANAHLLPEHEQAASKFHTAPRAVQQDQARGTIPRAFRCGVHPSREGGGRRCQCEAVAGFHLFRWWDARCTSPASSSRTTWGLHLARCCFDFRPASASPRPGSSRWGLHLASLLPTTGHAIARPWPCQTSPFHGTCGVAGNGGES